MPIHDELWSSTDQFRVFNSSVDRCCRRARCALTPPLLDAHCTSPEGGDLE
jgi:hypothetical protein